MNYRTVVSIVLLLVTMRTNQARGQERGYLCCDSGPSVFSNGYRGLVTGTLFGLSTAYLIERSNGINNGEWKSLLFGSGVGLLSGAALGVSLGLFDATDDRYRYGQYIVRDALYGSGFGALLGAASGGLAVIKTEKAEHVLFGAAIGVIAGTALGSIIGIIEGQKETERAFRPRRAPIPVTATVTIAQGANSHYYFGPALFGTF
jgi:hypothetical protein